MRAQMKHRTTKRSLFIENGGSRTAHVCVWVWARAYKLPFSLLLFFLFIITGPSTPFSNVTADNLFIFSFSDAFFNELGKVSRAGQRNLPLRIVRFVIYQLPQQGSGGIWEEGKRKCVRASLLITKMLYNSWFLFFCCRWSPLVFFKLLVVDNWIGFDFDVAGRRFVEWLKTVEMRIELIFVSRLRKTQINLWSSEWQGFSNDRPSWGLGHLHILWSIS